MAWAQNCMDNSLWEVSEVGSSKVSWGPVVHPGLVHISMNTSGNCNSTSCSCKVGSQKKCKRVLEKNSPFSQETGEMGWEKKK